MRRVHHQTLSQVSTHTYWAFKSAYDLLGDMNALQAMALSKRQAYRRGQYLTSGHPSQSTKTHQATGTS